jgi:hypothetical protein
MNKLDSVVACSDASNFDFESELFVVSKYFICSGASN